MFNARRLLVFAATYVLLYVLVLQSPAFERVFIEGLTVPAAAWAINALGLSAEPVVASGSRLIAPGGNLNVLRGCEGLDLLGLWLAAVAAGTFTWRQRCLAWALGSAAVFMLNQLRLISLWQLYRTHRAWFGDAHGLWWPLALVAMVWTLYALWPRGLAATPMAVQR